MATKKTTTARAAKPATATEYVYVQDNCACCKCHHGFWHWLGKLILILVIFALGVFAGIHCNCGHHMMNRAMMHRPHMTFNDAGCMDTSKMKPEMIQKVMIADANHDNCLTRDEMKASVKAMHDKMVAAHAAQTAPVAE